MTDAEFDLALITSGFALAAEDGWGRVSIAAAARQAGLPLDRARQRFPGRGAILMRFGLLADQHALKDLVAGAPVREALFDMVMRRLDAFQPHRAGLMALFRALPTEPGTALLLMSATQRSMAWLLEAAGVPTHDPLGSLRAKGLVAVWLWTLRAWSSDKTEDLSETMAALDRALSQAERASEFLPPPTLSSGRSPDPPFHEPPPPPPMSDLREEPPFEPSI